MVMMMGGRGVGLHWLVGRQLVGLCSACVEGGHQDRQYAVGENKTGWLGSGTAQMDEVGGGRWAKVPAQGSSHTRQQVEFSPLVVCSGRVAGAAGGDPYWTEASRKWPVQLDKEILNGEHLCLTSQGSGFKSPTRCYVCTCATARRFVLLQTGPGSRSHPARALARIGTACDTDSTVQNDTSPATQHPGRNRVYLAGCWQIDGGSAPAFGDKSMGRAYNAQSHPLPDAIGSLAVARTHIYYVEISQSK
ncbi:uncharacterized protein TRIVIDRAFT_64303 [Trichoderma virens Gv29-8]|uniref:Uncharacterized protein n=1 Tax=Hypocrea virens (strain Gv29-8 / FGSC 10586) TaxID=413071 RepID=G9MQH5_HYPVG|nr:uncharacterized protein TRIVIDRAFT_64303 [Trichoderma virens Gv29-8]EHK24184.1 hypothetical protein TRIVIDRAFT_64303 [Trichoderma virens Gv29-8]